MLAELKESRNQEARYQQFWQTFTEFLQNGGSVKRKFYRREDLRKVIDIFRTETLTHEGEAFLLEVRAGYPVSSDIRDATFRITASTMDGRTASESLYPLNHYKSLLPVALSDDLDSLADVEKIVREFNSSRKASEVQS